MVPDFGDLAETMKAICYLFLSNSGLGRHRTFGIPDVMDNIFIGYIVCEDFGVLLKP